jgi:hypothetical protein
MSRTIRVSTFSVIPPARTHRAVARTATAAVVTVCSALAFASPAAAGVFDKHLAVDCPQPYSQTCPPRDGLSVTTTGPIIITFTADGNPPQCAGIIAQIYVDGRLTHQTRLEPGRSLNRYNNLPPGTHQVDVQAEGIQGGCNTGAMSGWSGNLHITTDADAVPG